MKIIPTLKHFEKMPYDVILYSSIHSDKILRSKVLGSDQKELDSDDLLGYQPY
ncbi:hypothetical protein [Psychromonas ingrahamii]|uniref:hypothetical protein n=1 Tax=Psychromonas ingrahamii TaxID=357794 RepID=UPI0002EF0B70|nr:hypothetical protein [Psychromonas ingrahamii]